MLRRRAFAYTMMMIAGIISGYFIFEKCVVVRGALVMVAAGVSVVIMSMSRDHADRGIFCPGGTGQGGIRRFTLCPGAKVELPRLILFMAAGLLLFTNAFIRYERPAAIEGQPVELPYECSLEGRVSTVSVNEDKIILIVSERQNRIGKIRVTYRLPEYYELTPEDDLYDPYALTGEYIRFSGKLRDPDPADNPGCFNYRTYLRGHGIGHTFSASRIELADRESASAVSGGRHGGGAGDGAANSTANGSGNSATNGTANGSGDGSGSGRRTHFPNLSGCLVRIREGFLSLFHEDIRGFVRGAVFGDKSAIDDELRESFNTNQTGHILAVSGLHIGFLYALLVALTRKRKGLHVTLLIVLVMFLYGEMTVWSASTIRAVTVTGTALIAVHILRCFDLLTATSVSGMLILAAEPYQLFDAGFQMSFMALAGIAFLNKPISHFAGKGVGIAASVQAGVVPPSVFAFHRFNALSVLINIPIIALASLLVSACIIILMVYAAGMPIPSLAVTATEGLCLLIIRLNALLAAGGRFSNLVVSGDPAWAVMVIMLLFMLASEWTRIRILRHEYKRILTASLCIVLFCTALSAAAADPFADDEVVFVAVGQGDCTHIRAEGHDVLIDGGGDSEYNVGKNTLMPYLLSNGADNVDIALVTHLHTDHYRGIVELAEQYPVGRIGIPEDYRKSLEKEYSRQSASAGQHTGSAAGQPRSNAAGRPASTTGKAAGTAGFSSNTAGASSMLPPQDRILYLHQGERLNISGDVYIEPLWPLPGAGSTEIDDPNENNMVYMIHYKGKKIMVTGDLLEADELEMVEHYKDTDKLDCDVLKVAHHGSKSSSSEAFLDAASPSVAVIQVGRNNLYGHPHQQTLDRLEARGVKVYRTDINGAVGIDIRRKGTIKVDTMR